jgi:hypothetical protein
LRNRIVSHTALAEAALSQIALRALDHELLAKQPGHSLHGRHVWLQNSQSRHDNALVDIVAIVENFASRRLLDLRPVVTTDQVFTWEKRRKAWAEHGPVDLTRITHWRKLLGFIEARNAIQHGLGRLTDYQLDQARRLESLTRLSAAQIRTIGDVVFVDARTVGECQHVCAKFVISLDSTAPGK